MQKRCPVAPAARKVSSFRSSLFPKQCPFPSLASGSSWPVHTRPIPVASQHPRARAWWCPASPPPRAPSPVASGPLRRPWAERAFLCCGPMPSQPPGRGKCPFAVERGPERRRTVPADSPFVPAPVPRRQEGSEGGLSSAVREAGDQDRRPPALLQSPVSSSHLSPASRTLRRGNA